MTYPRFITEALLQLDFQDTQGIHLGDGEIETTLPTHEADTDGVLIVTTDMCPGQFDWSAFFNRTISSDHIVVPDAYPATLSVPLVDLFYTNIHASWSVGAVYYK